MLDLFQMGVDGSDCGGLLPLVRVIRKGIFPLVQIIIPIGLIIFGTIDLGSLVSDLELTTEPSSKLIVKFLISLLHLILNSNILFKIHHLTFH